MKLTIRAASAALALALAAASAQADTYRLATNVTEDSTAGQLLAEFAAAVETRTEGRVKFKMFHNGVLGEQAQYLQQIQSAVLDAGLVNSGTLETVVPAVGVMNLPYMFRSSEEYGTVMTDAGVLGTLGAAAGEQKINVLGFISSGFRSIYTTKPVVDFAGLKGLKLRSIASPTYTEMVSLFGAVPTPLPFGELYSGLQAGVVDGAEGGAATGDGPGTGSGVRSGGVAQAASPNNASASRVWDLMGLLRVLPVGSAVRSWASRPIMRFP